MCALKLPSIDAGVVLVLALSDLGLSPAAAPTRRAYRARLLMHDICVLLLRSLGVDAGASAASSRTRWPR